MATRSWKKGTFLRSDGLRLTRLFTVDRAMPVLEYTGIGHGGDTISFPDKDGNMVWHFGFKIAPDVEELPVPRDKGAANRPADPEQAELGVKINADRIPTLIAELLSVYNEYNRSFPVTGRKRTSPGWRSR